MTIRYCSNSSYIMKAPPPTHTHTHTHSVACLSWWDMACSGTVNICTGSISQLSMSDPQTHCQTNTYSGSLLCHNTDSNLLNLIKHASESSTHMLLHNCGAGFSVCLAFITSSLVDLGTLWNTTTQCTNSLHMCDFTAIHLEQINRELLSQCS